METREGDINHCHERVLHVRQEKLISHVFSPPSRHPRTSFNSQTNITTMLDPSITTTIDAEYPCRLPQLLQLSALIGDVTSPLELFRNPPNVQRTALPARKPSSSTVSKPPARPSSRAHSSKEAATPSRSSPRTNALLRDSSRSASAPSSQQASVHKIHRIRGVRMSMF